VRRAFGVDWNQPFVRERWEAWLVLVGFSIGAVGLFATFVGIVVLDFADWGMWTFLLAWFGGIGLTVVVLRASKRILGSYYPLWRPIATLSLEVRFIGRAAIEAAEIVEWPRAVGRLLTIALPISFFALFFSIPIAGSIYGP
jgi:hypothetical protein